MITNQQHITLDLNGSRSNEIVTAHQYDDKLRVIVATITNNGAPVDESIGAESGVFLRIRKSDGTCVERFGLERSPGLVSVLLGSDDLSCVGENQAEFTFKIKDDDGETRILTTSSFTIMVQPACTEAI